jgi:DNA modification methylase
MSRAKSLPMLYGDLSRWALIAGDSLDLLQTFPARCVDAVVTDPPYGINISRKGWDGGPLSGPQVFEQFTEAWASEVARVLKPGGHLVAFGSPRTYHRLANGIEDGGLEIRDQLLWLHGRGVPKSGMRADGIALGLRPAYEPIVLARTALTGSATATIAQYGTGGLDIQSCRIDREDDRLGYWPSPLLLTHESNCSADRCQPSCAVRAVDRSGPKTPRLSRMFFIGKTTRVEREAGLERLPKQRHSAVFDSSTPLSRPRANVHPTVKPIELMRWLIRLTCPPGGLVLDPFSGSGSTGIAAALEDRQFVGIEQEPEYVRIARARISHWLEQQQISAAQS